MIKHRLTPRGDSTDPWVVHTPGSASTSRFPDGYDPLENAAHSYPSIFCWELFWALFKDESLDYIINKWWNRIYTKPFPEEGGMLLDLVQKIYNRLIDAGHEDQKIDPKENDYELPTKSILKGLEGFSETNVKKLFIPEDIMGKVLSKSTTKSTAKSKEKVSATKKKAPVEEAPVAKGKAGKVVAKGKAKADPVKVTEDEDNGEYPKWITNSKPGSKAHESKVRICELLLERKHTDTEIALIIDSELEYKVTEDRINFYRYTMNMGRFTPLGFSKPKTDIEKIGGDDSESKAPPKAPPKAKTSKTPAPPAPVAPVVKKKLILKNKK